MFVLACIAFGGLAGCAGAVALDRWIRTVRPRDYTAITGLDPVTHKPIGSMPAGWLDEHHTKAAR